MLRLPYVTTPATAATLIVPDREPPPGFAPIATVTVPVNPVAVFPCVSRAVPGAAGVIAAPAVAVVGWTVNTSCVAVPGVILNAVLAAPIIPPAVATTV